MTFCEVFLRKKWVATDFIIWVTPHSSEVISMFRNNMEMFLNRLFFGRRAMWNVTEVRDNAGVSEVDGSGIPVSRNMNMRLIEDWTAPHSVKMASSWSLKFSLMANVSLSRFIITQVEIQLWKQPTDQFKRHFDQSCYQG